jgi:transposase
MVGRRRRPGKRSCVCFAEPPLSKDHPRWKELDEQLPQNHIARILVRGISLLDLQPLYDSYSASGSAPYRPELLLAMILIERHQGHSSPSQWHRHARESSLLEWAGFGIQPARSVWYEFRDRVALFLDEWNRQILHTARARGLTPAQRGALDGSSVEANASRHRLLNEERLEKRQEQWETVLHSDALGQPPPHVPAWMAKNPQTRRAQYDRYQRAREHLKQLLAANQKRIPSERRAANKVVVSVSDPEAALGLDKLKVFRPLYTIQLMRDLDSPLFLGYEVFAQSTDAGTLQPMLRRTADLAGVSLQEVLADSGYVTGGELAVCQAAGVTLYGPWKENEFRAKRPSKRPKLFDKEQFVWLPDEKTYRCPRGHLLTYQGREQRDRSGDRVEWYSRFRCPPQHCLACPLQAQCTMSPRSGRSLRRSQHEELVEQHRARMKSDQAKATYRLRGQTIELGFADFKQHRRLRRFCGRGLAKARAELGLAVLVHNSRYVAATNPNLDSS